MNNSRWRPTTGSIYNYRPVADKNVISNFTTMFPGVAITMHYRQSSNFIEIYEKFNMAAGFVAAMLNYT